MAPMVALITALIIPKPRWIPRRGINQSPTMAPTILIVTDDAKADSLHTLTSQPPGHKTNK
jgi:hypothetical protein